MKRIILLFIIGIFLINLVYAEENCKIAWPQFGVVECDVTDETFKLDVTPTNCQSENPYYCQFNFDCSGKIDCNIYSTDMNLYCGKGSWAPFIEVYKDGGSATTYDTEHVSYPDIRDFKNVLIKSLCWGTFLGINKKALDGSSKISMTYKNKYLYDTNFDYPRHKVEESVGCIPNGIMYKKGYTSQLPSSWVDSNGIDKDSKPSNLIESMPTNMDEGETYSYLYGWREVPGLNLIKGKDGNIAGYCGGILGDRKLISYSQVSGGDGCYLIPTSVQKNVECCYNEDCKWKDTSGRYVCDPTTFTCSLERPCNADYECQIIGEETCTNKIQTSWKCDISNVWFPYKGTCKISTKNVTCCSDNECSNKEYCDKELGCKPAYILSDCPPGKCCISGGNYKEKLCNQTECCTNGGYVGDCKEICIKQESQSNPLTEFKIPDINIKSIQETRDSYCNGLAPFIQGVALVADLFGGSGAFTSTITTVNGALCTSSIEKTIKNIVI